MKTKWKKKELNEPTDMVNSSTLSILCLKQSTLNKIFKACLPYADDSEFQVHYRSATFCCEVDNVTVLFTLPTVFYNFDQEVGHSSVEYHLNDISNNAELVKPFSLHMMKDPSIKELETSLYEFFDTVELYEVADNSFHRHPGRFSFSSIDYDKDPEEPGVVYRKANATNIPQTDSVIYWGRKGEVVTSETRIVSVSPHTDGGVSGTYTEVPTTTYIENDISDPLNKALIGKNNRERFVTVNSSIVVEQYNVIESIVNNMNILQPNTDFIIPERIQQARTYWGKQASKQSTKEEEKELAEMYGYDLSDKDDIEEWEETKDYYLKDMYGN